jgi:hypothetical protein
MGVINTSQSFANGDSVTSTKLNNITSGSTFDSGAVSGTGLTVTAGGLLSLGTVASSNMGNNSVLAGAITDGVITNAKISASAAIDLSKLATGALPSAITVASANIVDANVTASKLSGGQTGSPPIYGVRAWGRFDGTGTSPISPVYGGNIASITRVSTGTFAVLFTTAMTDANYSVVVSADNPIQTNGMAYAVNRVLSLATTGFTIVFTSVSVNPSIVCFQVIR